MKYEKQDDTRPNRSAHNCHSHSSLPARLPRPQQIARGAPSPSRYDPNSTTSMSATMMPDTSHSSRHLLRAARWLRSALTSCRTPSWVRSAVVAICWSMVTSCCPWSLIRTARSCVVGFGWRQRVVEVGVERAGKGGSGGCLMLHKAPPHPPMNPDPPSPPRKHTLRARPT